MSKTRKVTVTVSRYYSKQTEVEIDVPVNIKDDELVDFLVDCAEIDRKADEQLENERFELDDETFEYDDPTNEMGGTL